MSDNKSFKQHWQEMNLATKIAFCFVFIWLIPLIFVIQAFVFIWNSIVNFVHWIVCKVQNN